MTVRLATDNDVLIKLSAYRLLLELGSMVGGLPAVGLLGVARFVVWQRLERGTGLNDPGAAADQFDAVVDAATILEPSQEELALATELEEAALRADVDLDTGESQLCAIAIERSFPLMATGDKRAIVAMESIYDVVEALDKLENSMVCLEQLMTVFVGSLGGTRVRELVCAEPAVDKSVAICFECRQELDGDDYRSEGLASYVGDLRRRAPRILAGDVSELLSGA